MDQLIHVGVTALNGMGARFCSYAGAMFIQVGVLVAVLLALDVLLRRRLRAAVRYWIWMLVFVKLVFPPGLAAPTGIGYWCGVQIRSSPAPRYEAPGTKNEGIDSRSQSLPPNPEEPLPTDTASSADGLAAPIASIAVGAESLTWQAVIFFLWGAGVLIFAGWMIQRMLFVRRLVMQGHPAPESVLDLLDQCRRHMGIHQRVDLRLSSQTFSPAVCGLVRPTILMPTALLERLPPENLRAVLIHELAHVKRGDLWINCLQTALQIVYFYNPLVWLANAIVRRVREQAVDEMSLVALGAEARSYGTTLIDMAEMAFLRASSALGLLGVAESKKSLEGRIKHMITRPIPKRANVGIAGALAIIAIGAALLPMATAQTETPAGKFVARLPNGATLELVGVCDWPTQDPTCWKADGSKLDRNLRPARWTQRPKAGEYGFMVQVTGPETPELFWNSIGGAKGTQGECDVVDSRGRSLAGYKAVLASLPGTAAETTIRVGVAAGPWTTLASHNGHGMKAHAGHESILWSQAFEDAKGTRVIVSGPWHQDRARRIVAVDNQGVIHTDARNTWVAAGNVGQLREAMFSSLKHNDIREFQYQARSYEWVEFDGVSLRPGHQTVVTVGVGAPAERTPRAGGALPGPENATDKAYSRTCLASLGKVLLLYANDHDDRLPAGIGEVRGQLNPQEAQWLLENVVYLGKDLTVAGYPGRAVAYDRTMLAEGKGTNVLYLDSHVDFENPQELERLGISSVRWDAALRTYEVNRSVADFPRTEDFSTPEAAYATINRIDQGDPSAWQKVSVAALAERFARQKGARQTTGDPEWAKVLGHARIVEVLVWDDTHAAVLAQLPQGMSSRKIAAPIDVRYLERENGRWLNSGNNRCWTVEEAWAAFLARLEKAGRDSVKAGGHGL